MGLSQRGAKGCGDPFAMLAGVMPFSMAFIKATKNAFSAKPGKASTSHVASHSFGKQKSIVRSDTHGYTYPSVIRLCTVLGSFSALSDPAPLTRL